MNLKNHKYILVLSIILMFSACKQDDTSPEADFKAENRKGLGVSGADILSDDFYQSITIEFVYSLGTRPRQATIDAFASFLNERINKPGGINIVETEIQPPSGAPFNTQEIRDIEDEHRTRYTEGDDIAVYVFFSNGKSVNDTQSTVTLGTAYQNTSIVVYEKTLQELSASQNVELSILEQTTLNHEFGHIFGLVNILDDDIHTDHEDPSNSRHCVVEDCLLYFESSAFRKIELLKLRAQVPTFDALCIADLQAKGGK